MIAQTGASLVLSSSWQSVPTGFVQVNTLLEEHGIPACVGQTVENGSTGLGAQRRATEISQWVASHEKLCSGGWVAIDDLDLGRFLPAANFVRTEAEVGLTDEHARQAIELLGGPDATLPSLPSAPKKPAGFKFLITRDELQRELLRATSVQQPA